MRELVLDTRDAPGRRPALDVSPFDVRPNPVVSVFRSVAEAVLAAAVALTRRAFAMPFATFVVVMSLWGATAILGNIAGQTRGHPAPLFAARSMEQPTRPQAQANAGTSPRPVAATAVAEPAVVPQPPERNIAAIISETVPQAPMRLTPQAGTVSNDMIRELQQVLAARGVYQGTIDGVMGQRTERAIRQAEQALGLPETGRATERLLERLRAGDRRLAAR